MFILFSKRKLLLSVKFGTDFQNSQFLMYFHFLTEKVKSGRDFRIQLFHQLRTSGAVLPF